MIYVFLAFVGSVSPKQNLGFCRLFLLVRMGVESLCSDGCAAHEFNKNFEEEEGDAGGERGRGQAKKKKPTGRGVQNYSRHGVREVLSFFTMLCFPFFHVLCFVENWVLLLQMGARNRTCNVPNSLDTFCGRWVKERLWGGKEKFVFGSLLLWGWIVDILIRFGLCWDSFGSSVDAQCYEDFLNGVDTSIS